ncbi:uncharacterized protein [Amphiura filiformis]|uniref:uncharacterized protein n=1 Tax=Amphiura filiformis TaxID=82378 RepID=UPI003B226052
MTEKCVRCNEEEPKVECSDCLSSKRKGEVASLCDACSELIHVGFLGEHDVQPIALKLKKQEFKTQLEVFKKYDQQLKFKQTEIGYAKQDIDTRVGVTQRAIHDALGKVFNAMKEKEQELIGIVKESVAQKKASLSDCETKIAETVTKYNEIMKETDGVLKAEQSDFMELCEGVQEKITDDSILKIQSCFPSLGALPTIDITHLLTSVERVQLSDVDEGIDTSMPDAPRTVEEGDVLKVFMESRMDTRGYFWVSRDMDPELNSILDNISYQMREDIVLNPIERAEITEGMVCCGQYQQDHRWYRGRVEQVKANQVGGACLFRRDRQWGRALVEQVKQNKAHVRWLDYAHDNEVPLSHLYPLKEEFKAIPFQAMQCSLLEEFEGEMPRPARWEFSDHTANAPLECTIIKVLTEKQIYIVELKNKEKSHIDMKQRLQTKIDESKGKKDTIQCRDIRYMKDYTPPPASEIRAKQKQERERKGKRGGKDRRGQGGQQADESESGKSGRSTPDGQGDKRERKGKRGGKDRRGQGGQQADESESGKSGRSTPDGQGDKKPDRSVEGSPNQQNSSGGETSGGQQVTIMKKSGEGASTDQTSKPSDSGEGKPANDKAPDAAKDDTQAPQEPQSQNDNKPNSIINTDAPSLNTKDPIVQDQSKVFVPISGEKVPISSVGSINLSYPTVKEREAMVPPMQTFITPSTGSGVTVAAIMSTPPRSSAQESEEDERERQLTERLAQQGDHGMAHSPDSASDLLPEVSQLFESQRNLGGQGGVPLPGQIMQGGYANYPGAGYNYNMGGMQPQHGYYSAWGVPGRVPMGPQGMPLQQPIHPGEMLPEHMHQAEITTRSPPPPYSREVEQAIPNNSTTEWDENSWNQPPARQTAGPGRFEDRRDSSAAEEDNYRDGLDVDPLGAFKEDGNDRSHSIDSSPITDQRRPASYRNRQGPPHHPHHHQQQQSRYSCYRCGDTTHMIRDCPVPPAPGERPPKRQGGRGPRNDRRSGQYRKGERGGRR